MRPFSLEQAKQGKKVVTRDGREVKQFTMFENVSDGYVKLWGVVGNSVRGWFDGGRYMTSEVEHSLDLFMATEKKTVWVNLYKNKATDAEVLGSKVTYESKKLAEDVCRWDDVAWEYLGAHPIEIEV